MSIFDSLLLCLTLYPHQNIHKLSGPLSWGHGITIHKFLWPLELGICTHNPQTEWLLEWLLDLGTWIHSSQCGGPDELHQSVCVLLHSRNFAFRGKSITFLMDHGTMSHRMFGLIKVIRPPHEMRERMR